MLIKYENHHGLNQCPQIFWFAFEENGHTVAWSTIKWQVSLTNGFFLSILVGYTGMLGFHCFQLSLCLLTFNFRLCCGMIKVLQSGLCSGQLLLNPEHLNIYLHYILGICLLQGLLHGAVGERSQNKLSRLSLYQTLRQYVFTYIHFFPIK